MKKYGIMFIIVISIISCNSEELEFSCNPVINDYVKSNISELLKISFGEFLAFDTPLQRAVFRSYSPERKFELWYLKLEKTLQSDIWSDLEANHIEGLKNNLCIEYFMEDEKHNSIKTEGDTFAKNWMDFGKDELNWNERRVAFVVSSLYFYEADYIYSLSKLNDISTNTIESTESICDCNITSDFCDLELTCTTSCSGSSSGCGWLWMQPCNGNCL